MALITKEVEIGHRLPSRSKVVSQEMMTRYIDTLHSIRFGKRTSSGINLHTDDEYARSQGLEGAVADGMISTAMLSAMMVDLFGESYVRGGKLSTTYIKPVHAGDKLTLKAIVKQKVAEGPRVRVVLEVWCENQKGGKVTVGTASALVSCP